MTPAVDGATPTDPRPEWETIVAKALDPLSEGSVAYVTEGAVIAIRAALAAAGLRIVGPQDDGEAERLRTALRAHFAGDWELGRITDINHVDGCECEPCDAYTVEHVDPRCTEGDSYPVLSLYSGEWTAWQLRLDTLARALEVARESFVGDDFSAEMDAAASMHIAGAARPADPAKET
jgi:hypothetical protein